MTCSTRSDSAAPAWWRELLWLTLFFGAVYGFMLGGYPLGNPDEGRYAEIPREMVASGDWVTPRLNGVNYFEKPPLVYWAGAVALEVLGPSEWSMRATPALCALFGVLCAYVAGRRLYGYKAGRAGALVLGSSLLYFALAHILILDMAVSVFMSATLFCFILGVREAPGGRRRAWFYGLYACAALATLSKGLIGFLLPGAVMFTWLLVFNQWRRLRPLYLPTGVVLFLLVAAPWHLLAAQRNPDWAYFYFVREHWLRFTTTMHSRVQPWWFFVPIVLIGLFPWVGYLGSACRSALAGGWGRRKENADAWFLVTWAVVIFLFFSKSQSKLIPYILPVLPPLAVMIGAWFARLLEEENAVARLRPGMRVFSLVCGVLAVGLVVTVLHPTILPGRAQALALRPYAYVLAGVLLVGGVAALWMTRRRGVRSALWTQAATTLAMYLLLVAASPILHKPSTIQLARQVAAQARPEDLIYHYRDFFHDFTYYSGRIVGLVDTTNELEPEIDPVAAKSGRFIDDAEFRRQWREPRRIWVVAQKKEVTALFADPSFHYHLLGETPRFYLFSNQP